MGRAGTIDCSTQQRRFLECFAACGKILIAARWAKLSRAAHYNWMREDPTYPERFREVEARAARMLEDEAVRRAHDGVREPVFYKGKICGYKLVYSDALLSQLLRANNPGKFSERMQHTGADGGPVQHVMTISDLDRMRADDDGETTP